MPGGRWWLPWMLCVH
ncbi:hypothetical protein Patl1_04752 [Pistacia atlantica]|uniref:Uncharacterized protein n=1 Tax=Pistacia atlantica TaxID=434234 RepID=A0ACC1BQG7_9ROSI|nr:hypothetical protein Patl1_04752 [Pistacia atlantica]